MRLRPPDAVRARAGRDRVLAWVPSGDSSIVATERVLLLPAGSTPERIPWDLVLRVLWHEHTVEVTSQDVAGAPAVVHRVAYAGAPGSLPEAVRERVNASIVVIRHVELRGEQGARLVARRDPADSALRWSVVFDPGLDARDPELRRAADEALGVLRSSLGV